MGSENVRAALKDSNLEDYSRYYNDLIERGYPLIVMAGEFDMQDGAIGVVKWMKETLTSLTDSDFWSQDRKIYYLEADKKTKIGGYY